MKGKKKTLVLILVFLHIDGCTHICQGCYYCHLWVTEEWTFFDHGTKDKHASSWG
jgi:hypothetical protein